MSQENFLKIIGSFLLCVGGGLAIAAVRDAAIHPDIGYIASTAEFLYAGGRWYRDIIPSHLSSFVPFLAFLRSASSERLSYDVILTITIAIQALSAVLVGVLGRSFGLGRAEAFAASSLCFLLFMIAEGWTPLMEAYVVFFSLSAFNLYVIWCQYDTKGEHIPLGVSIYFRCFLVGILCGVAFTFKQYGMATMASIAIADFYYHWQSWRKLIARQLSFAMGFFAVILGYYGTIVYLADADVLVITGDLLGGWYERRYWLFPQYLFNMFLIFPGLLLAFVGMSKVLAKRRPESMGLVLLALTNMLPGFVRPYPHYFHLALPYCVLIAFLFLDESDKEFCRSFVKRFALLVCLFIIPLATGLFFAHSVYSLDIRNMQLANSSRLSDILHGRQNILNLCNPILHHTLQLPPLSKQLGYNFLDVCSEEELKDGLAKADYVLTVGDLYNIYLSHSVLYNVYPTLSSEFEPYYEVPSPPGMSDEAKFSSLVCKVWKRRSS